MPLSVLLDLDRLHLVAHGERHRAALARVPRPGDAITMLCGYTDLVEYTGRTADFVGVRTCWPCDLAYRRQLGLCVPPDHPGARRL
ncbi:zinc finger protein [Amycolatopsis sp. cmx-8-4]|uniref:zinc finger protein n=1 Tax=Amycolatopsis sp. cmx-8-4 TaxID=2790947 RepID=UPI003978BD76